MLHRHMHVLLEERESLGDAASEIAWAAELPPSTATSTQPRRRHQASTLAPLSTLWPLSPRASRSSSRFLGSNSS